MSVQLIVRILQAPDSVEYRSLCKMPEMKVKMFAEIVSTSADDVDVDDAISTTEDDSDNIFSAIFPITVGCNYSVVVSSLAKGEVLSKQRRGVMVRAA